jgi:FkbM family methyltransferase
MKLHSIESSYEKDEREMLLSLANPGDVLFDVGAYVGWYSADFASKVPESKAYAFEPIPECRKELNKNIANLKNVFVYSFGLSDKTDFVDFYISEREPGTASMAPLEEDRFGPSTVIKKLVTTLDEQCCEYHPTPNIIKIDVEGAELLVLVGAKRIIEKHLPIIQCEMLRKWTKRFNYHPNDIIAFLSQFGYKCFTLSNGNLQPFKEMTDEITETNFFFLPERTL